ncbi:MAG: LysR family transcriptional regulator [Gammaproteobacteria bacterium]|nr:LysR family transcriptional regulator [Gammaproteobacteria bacterium]
MDRISAMQIFRRVVEAGSFSAVSREMQLSQPTVSKQIAALEDHLGTKLLSRSTRQLNLTDAGHHYYERCCQILDELSGAEAEIREQQTLPTGLLRVNVPIAAGRMKILPLVWKFRERYPDLKIDMHFDDHYVDLVKEGVDVAIRIGDLSDSSLVARKMGTIPRYTVASPEYLEKHGEPETLEDLHQHECVVYNLLNTRNEWHFTSKQGKEKISVKGGFSSNSPDAMREAALTGQGVAVILGWLVEEDIEQGRLKVVLNDYVPTALGLNAIYPERRFMPAKLSLFLDFLQSELQG